MKAKRWGKFKFGDYYTSWIAIAILLLFSTASILLELSLLFVIFPLVYAGIWLGAILVPHREQFTISNDGITVFLGEKVKKVNLPSELTIVVSYADICPPLAIRTAVGNQTHILKDKFAVSILQKMPVEVVLKALHQNHIQKYTTSSIKTVFDDNRYIYSFVCDQYLFDALIANKKCSLIVPELLSKAMSFASKVEDMHIDIGY